MEIPFIDPHTRMLALPGIAGDLLTVATTAWTLSERYQAASNWLDILKQARRYLNQNEATTVTPEEVAMREIVESVERPQIVSSLKRPYSGYDRAFEPRKFHKGRYIQEGQLWKELQAQDRNRDDMGVGLEIGPGTGTAGHWSTSSSGLISSCAQGAAFNERRGKAIWITRIDFWARIRYEPYLTTSLPGNANIYVALVLDTQTNGALFDTEDVYNTGTPGLSEVPRRELEFTSRFRVLKHIRIDAKPPPMVFNNFTNSVQYAGYDQNFTLHHEFKTPLEVNFKPGATGGEIANVVDNSVHAVLFTSDNTGAGENFVLASFISRMRFYS